MPHSSIRFTLALAALCGALALAQGPAFAESGRSARGERSQSNEQRLFRAGPDGKSGGSFRSGAGLFDRNAGSGLSVRTERARWDRGADRRDRSDAMSGRRGRSDILARGTGRHDSFLGYRDGRRLERIERRDDRHWGDDEDRPGFQGGRTLTTFDVGDWSGGSSFIYYGLSPSAGSTSDGSGLMGRSGPKIIDVATERLDRRPIGPSGIDVVQTGGAKIIRIAPGYRMASSARTETERRTRDLGLQPWSSGWLSWCGRTYRSFDAELGTYAERDGTVRFCDPGRR